MAKLRKYNPKRDGHCVGQWIRELYADMHRYMTSLPEDHMTAERKNGAAWAMNTSMLEVMGGWCRCPWCKNSVAKVEEYFQKTKDTHEEKTN